jgi:quinolinate synthase
MVLDELEFAKEDHPDALVVIHPEARQELLDRADVVTSTSGMVRMAAEYDKLIVGTERGLVDKIQKDYPEKTFIPLSKAAVCGNMKANTLAKLAWSLDHLQFEVTMPEEIRSRAETALQRMLDISGGWQGSTPEAKQLEMAGIRSEGCGCA